MTKQKPQNIEEYVAQFPIGTQQILNDLLECLSEVVPVAEKGLKWSVPSFTYHRVLFTVPSFTYHRVLFTVAAFKHHINFYPTPATLNNFNEELKGFSTTKSALQLPLTKPLPLDLIREMARYRYNDVVENDAKWM